MESDQLTISAALYWIIGVSGTIILLLIGVVGYFLKKSYNDRDNHEEKQERNYQAMREMISTLDKTINKLDALLDNFSRTTEKRLDAHSEKINNHEKRIYYLEK